MLDLGVDEPLELGEGDDVVEAPLHVGARNPVQRAVHEDVLPRRRLVVEPGAELEQGDDAAAASHAAGRRRDHLRDHL